MGITSCCVEREVALVENVCKLMDGDDGLAGWSWGLEGRNTGRSGTKSHGKNPVVVSTKCKYLCITCYPLPEIIHYGKGTKHSRRQSHPTGSGQPATVISHSRAETLMHEQGSCGGQDGGYI